MSSDEVERLREENARLHAQLDAARQQADQWREVAEERRVTLERFRQHPVVRVLFRIAQAVLPWLRTARHRAAPAVRTAREVRRRGAALRVLPAKLGAPQRERQLRADVRRLPEPPADARSVSVVVLTRDGHERLATLLPALRRTVHEPLEIVVVDNASGRATQEFLAVQADIEVVRNEDHRSFSAANNAGVAASSGEVICLLNDDVEPLDPAWLGRMLGALHGEVAAVGAQLVYPRRGLLEGRYPDVTVQHLGTAFEPAADGVPLARNVGGGAPDPGAPPREVGAATAACLVVDRAAYDGIGGFDERYDFGAEDVDLCWRLRRAGHRVVVEPGAVLWHHEGATRHAASDPAAVRQRQQRNWDHLADRFGPPLRRSVELDRLRGGGTLATRPYTVAITITRDLEEAGYGDLHTARALRHELERFGWDVRFAERYRDAWYDLDADVDAVLGLLDTFDVRQVARPGLTTIAWVRNWADRWTAHPWFEEYDVVLASSRTVAERIAATTRHRPVVFPLATDPGRFTLPPDDRRRSGVVLTVNHHGFDRDVPALLEAVSDLELYGKGWDQVAQVRDRWRGQLPHDALPDLYARAEVVVDQAAHHTRDDASVNARVFDALAAGAAVVTDQIEGARELFGDDLPTYTTPQELATAVDRLRADPDATRTNTRQLRERVVTEHSWARRAERLQALLVERAERASFALLIGAPDRRVAPTWGDFHLAEALARELRARGHRCRTFTADRWGERTVAAYDVAVHLHGRGRAPRREGQLHVLWVISHPAELTDEELAEADLVLVASSRFADELRGRTTTPVEVLLQATDERRFRPLPADPAHTHDLAFVGNSKFTERPAVHDALAAGLDPVLYGANWEKFVDPRRVQATHVPNDELAAVYSSVRVLLNDHWPDMRRWGFVSNRLFDALACGATVVSDELPELDALFDGAVATYGTPAELATQVRHLLADDEERRARGRRGRDAVLAGHTFAHRADELLGHLRPLLAARAELGALAGGS